MNTNYTVFQIAEWFLAKAKETDAKLKPMKLQKLVYFAYGWFYAYYDEPLFAEKIFAWKHGPVVADLYGEYKRFKGNPIDHDFKKPVLNADAESILNQIWDAYSPLEDFSLSNITHREGSPWQISYETFGCSSVIPGTEIRDYFKTLVKEYSEQV